MAPLPPLTCLECCRVPNSVRGDAIFSAPRTFTGRGYHPGAITPERKRWHPPNGAHHLGSNVERRSAQGASSSTLPYFRCSSMLSRGSDTITLSVPEINEPCGSASRLMTWKDCACQCNLVTYHFSMILASSAKGKAVFI